MLEKAIISGVTHDTSEAKLTLIGVPDRPGVAARVFRALADAGVNIDMIVQNVSSQGLTDISFTLPKSDLAVAEPILEAACKDVDAAGLTHDSDIAKVSLIGAGMRSHPGVAADMFEALADGRDQHRDHLDLVDPDLVRRARRPTSSAPCRPSTTSSSSSPRSAPSA